VLQERRSRLLERRSTVSTVTATTTGLPVAKLAGADLKAARERLGVSLDHVAVDLRIRVPHLEALEQGLISLLPGNAYAVAYVRAYSGYLGLDAAEMVRRFKTETTQIGRRTELVFPIPMAERGLPAGAMVLLGVLLAIGAYTGWYRLSGDGRIPAEAVTAVPERLASLAEQALPPRAVPAEAIAGITPRNVPAEPEEPDALADPAPPVIAISPTSAAAAQLPPRPADPSAAGLAPVPVGIVDASRIVLRANADAWLLVKDRSGTVLLNRVLKAGESWPAPARTDLLLTTGNAGGTTIVMDGTTIASLGGDGTVRRDLSLDPDQIKDGKLASSVAAPLASTRPRQ
jgi:cytoskeleton protein RodZ